MNSVHPEPWARLRDLCSPEKKAFAKTLRHRATESEQILWQFLRGRKTGAKWRRQVVLRGYIADFYCPSLRLVLEVDGSSHWGRSQKDEERDAVLATIGLKTLRISAWYVLNHPSEVIVALKEFMARRVIS